MTESDLRLVLGLEIHVHVKTKSKMFCGCSADIWQKEPNTHVCPTCLGLPGALPVANFEAIQKTHIFGVAVGCTVNKASRFDRKHYFYPDLPKGYQISQYKDPLCGGNGIIERIHLEEDVAKSFHKAGKTYLDFNKSGIPLMEIVTKPVFTSVEDAVAFCRDIQKTIRLLGVSDADMEKGQMRLEANISLRDEKMEKENKLPGYKVEIKNINSFRFLAKAVKAEVARQQKLFSQGMKPIQENRGWSEEKGTTISQRSKEEAHDYRYFPEPDIPKMVFDDVYIEDVRRRMQMQMQIATTESDPPSLKLRRASGLGREEFGGDINEVIVKTLDSNPQAVENYKKGKINVLQFLVGQVMKETKGKGDPGTIAGMLRKMLN